MDNTIITALVGLACTLASSLATFLLTKKKYNAEVYAQQIENMTETFDLHKKMMDDALKMQDDKIKQLQRENDDLKQQVQHLQQQVVEMINTMCLDITCKSRKKGLLPIAAIPETTKSN